ncbi:hypothetical protein KJ780_01165 [Candidatus Micrarchaeota archaeon]|nr:hypothetical protein [Candidatus Micrarchaeota archaeon]
MENAVDIQTLNRLVLEKFLEMEWLEEKEKKYFLTDQGKMVLATLGIEEKDLY